MHYISCTEHANGLPRLLTRGVGSWYNMMWWWHRNWYSIPAPQGGVVSLARSGNRAFAIIPVVHNCIPADRLAS